MSSVWDHVTPVWYDSIVAAAGVKTLALTSLWSHERQWEEPTDAGAT